jgi:DNA processing protein
MLGVQSLGPIMPRRVAENEPTAGATGMKASLGLTAAERAPEVEADPRHEPRLRPGPDAAAMATRAPTVSPDPAADLERDAWVELLSVSGLGPVSFAALLGAFGSARAVVNAATAPGGPARLLQALADAAADTDGESVRTVFDGPAATAGASSAAQSIEGGSTGRRRILGSDLVFRICDAAARGSRAVEQVQALGLTVVTLEDASYPDRLRCVELPPPLLYVRGPATTLAAKASVAVVGTRRPTDKGRLIAGWIGSAIARTGAVVVSGLAVGIDGAAHAAVVAEGGRTVAVLGGGHARMFPAAHERLADAIVERGGAIVSELAPETCPSRGTFPRRNRLVSGLSDATVVVEAGRRSGALITAGWALEQGRECFLVPGPLDSPASAGCNAFLRSFPGQARVVAGVSELLEDLEITERATAVSGIVGAANPAGGSGRGNDPSSCAPAAGRGAVLALLGPAERALAEQLALGPATADQLALRTSLASAAVLSALTLLELRGLATGAYGRYSPAGPLAGWSGAGRRRSA